MGPGLAAKALGGRRLSLMVFGFSQVAMDIEPLVRIFRGDAVLHGFTHTYLGATVIGLICALTAPSVCQPLLNQWRPEPGSTLLNWLRGSRSISWPAAAISAFIGTYSHVFLDSIMHRDMRPFAPFSEGNALLHFVSLGDLHLLCVFSGMLGLLLLFAAFLMGPGRSVER